jgi:hypothetical protein
MEIKTALAFNGNSTAEYAVLFTNDSQSILRICEKPYPASPGGNKIALKQIRYKILEGTLFIRGTRIYHYDFEHLLYLINTWGPRSLWKIIHKHNDKLVVPFIEEDLVIHRWWWKNKIVKGVDLTDKEVLNWYLSKEEEPYEIATSNFIVREDL